MLSDRITALFTLLQCSNTDIARFAGCSSGNISKLKRGHRMPTADSRAALIPALTSWLYDTQDISVSGRTVTPRTKRTQALQRQKFGEKLNQVMTLLNLPNSHLASLLNVDNSLISRYRRGLLSPQRNEELSRKLSYILFSRAEKNGQSAELAQLCNINEKLFDADFFSEWLCRSEINEEASMAGHLLRSLNDFVPGKGLPPVINDLPVIETSSCYWGTEGLQNAVIRFLSDASEKGGELLLYSDESMDWMTEDQAFYTLWASLMAKCVRSGVKIKIIHNVDRNGPEMVDAIKGWFPLYISGMIEPYVFTRAKNPRFCHTIFLHKGHSCIHGFFPERSGHARWYDYITEEKQLQALKEEFDQMLSAASPFLKIYTADTFLDFHSAYMNYKEKQTFLLSGLPVVTMPESLLAQILDRADLDEEKRLAISIFYRKQREEFLNMLTRESITTFLASSAEDQKTINFSIDLLDLSLTCSPEEYTRHMEATLALAEKEPNFHLTLLEEMPFCDIQLLVRKDCVAVLRSHKPYCAFVFLNPTLTMAVSDYLDRLIQSESS